MVKDKIVKIKHKFTLNESSFIVPEEEKNTLQPYGVKESLYKLHHSKFWSLKRIMKLKLFSYTIWIM